MTKRMAFFLAGIILLSGCGKEMGKEKQAYRIATYTNEYLTDGVVTEEHRAVYTYDDQNQLVQVVGYENGMETSRSFLEYDEYGSVTGTVNESAEETLISEINYVRDGRGNILRSESYTNGVLGSVYEYTYDKRGNELSWTEIPSDAQADETEKFRQTVKKYDRWGNLTEETYKWPYHNIHVLFSYSDGRKVKQTEYDTEGEIAEYWVFSYDDKGRITGESLYSGEGILKFYAEYTFDETGLVCTKSNYDADGIPENYEDIFTYDEYGNELTQERVRDGEVYLRISKTYEPVAQEQ